MALAPLVALYVKFKLVSFAVRLALFLVVFEAFKRTLNWGLLEITSKIGGISIPCTFSYILNSLDILTMITFGASFYASIAIGKFFYRSLMTFL